MKRFIFLFIFAQTLFAYPPVDISFLVADVKYNSEQGAKIAEVQQGTMSKFEGFDYLEGAEGAVGQVFAEFLSSFPCSFWVAKNDCQHLPLAEKLLENGWRAWKPSISIPKASKPVKDPYNIADYKAVLLAKPRSIVQGFRKKNPAVIVIDTANRAYWFDKYKMSTLFLGDPILESAKPKWGLYPQEYSKKLTQQIHREIGSDFYVIKPLSYAMGSGILIVHKKDLDVTLKRIFAEKHTLRFHPDPAYRFWSYKLKSDTFLVEEFIPSDPIEFGGKHYNATMRLVFALVYNQKQTHLHYFGGYWILPRKALEEKGSLNEFHKADVINGVIASTVDPEILQVVEEELREPFLRMYERMLGIGEFL